MVQKYVCNIVTERDGRHTRAECVLDDEDNYTIEPDFSNFPLSGLAIARQFGPNETADESDKNVNVIVIGNRDIVDKIKDFLHDSTRNKMEVGYSIKKGFDVTYRFEKESHGWLRVEDIHKVEDGAVNIVDILIHKDVVPFMIQIVDQNFITSWVQDIKESDSVSTISKITVRNAEYIQNTGSQYTTGPAKSGRADEVGIYFIDPTRVAH